MARWIYLVYLNLPENNVCPTLMQNVRGSSVLKAVSGDGRELKWLTTRNLSKKT